MKEPESEARVQSSLDRLYARILRPGEDLVYQTPAAVWDGKNHDSEESNAPQHGVALLTNHRLALLHGFDVDDADSPGGSAPVKLDSMALGDIASVNTTPVGLIVQLVDESEFRIAMRDPLLSLRLEQEVNRARSAL